MAVFRVERTRDYTVMSNYHLRDKSLSLKAKGLLSQMLSLPDNWDYTLAGLAQINKESKDAIRSAINELEKNGYVIRRQTTDKSGKFAANEYIIYEHPCKQKESYNPTADEPLSEKPTTDEPIPEKSTQRNKEKENKKKRNTDLSNTDSLPSGSCGESKEFRERKRKEAISLESMNMYRELILENIDYDILHTELSYKADELNEIVELMVETVCTNRKTVRVAGNDFPQEVVKSRLLKLSADHIRFVLKCLDDNTTKIRNMKQYLLTTLFNAPLTMQNYYSSLVSHDMSAQPAW